MKQTFLIAVETFKELYQSKILLNVFILGITIAIAIYISSEMTYGAPARVGLDIGMGALSLSSIGIAIFMGATLIEKEIKNRTLYMIISRPVSRKSFYLGKMLGLSSILFVNIFLLVCFVIGLYWSVGGRFHYLIPWSLGFIFLESLVVLFCVVLISLLSGTAVAILSVLTLYIAGHAVEAVKETNMFETTGFLNYFIKLYSKFMPNFSKFNIKSFVLYDGVLSESFLYSSLLYAIVWIILLGFVSILIMNKKDFT